MSRSKYYGSIPVPEDMVSCPPALNIKKTSKTKTKRFIAQLVAQSPVLSDIEEASDERRSESTTSKHSHQSKGESSYYREYYNRSPDPIDEYHEYSPSVSPKSSSEYNKNKIMPPDPPTGSIASSVRENRKQQRQNDKESLAKKHKEEQEQQQAARIKEIAARRELAARKELERRRMTKAQIGTSGRERSEASQRRNKVRTQEQQQQQQHQAEQQEQQQVKESKYSKKKQSPERQQYRSSEGTTTRKSHKQHVSNNVTTSTTTKPIKPSSSAHNRRPRPSFSTISIISNDNMSVSTLAHSVATSVAGSVYTTASIISRRPAWGHYVVGFLIFVGWITNHGYYGEQFQPLFDLTKQQQQDEQHYPKIDPTFPNTDRRRRKIVVAGPHSKPSMLRSAGGAAVYLTQDYDKRSDYTPVKPVSNAFTALQGQDAANKGDDATTGNNNNNTTEVQESSSSSAAIGSNTDATATTISQNNTAVQDIAAKDTEQPEAASSTPMATPPTATEGKEKQDDIVSSAGLNATATA